MMLCYSHIFRDASAMHLGAALSAPGPVLILEPTLHVAREYIAALRPCRDTENGEGLAGRMRALMEAQGLIRGGRLHPQGIEAALIQEMARAGVEVRFLSVILSVEKEGEGYRVRALCLDSEETFFCRCFHDAPAAAAPRYHALVKTAMHFSLPQGAELTPTIYPDLWILALDAAGRTPSQLRREMAATPGLTVIHPAHVLCPLEETAPDFLEALAMGEKGGAAL